MRAVGNTWGVYPGAHTNPSGVEPKLLQRPHTRKHPHVSIHTLCRHVPTQQTPRQPENTHTQLDKHTQLTRTHITCPNHKKQSLNINSSPTIHKHPPKTHHVHRRLPSIIANAHSKDVLQNTQLVGGSLPPPAPGGCLKVRPLRRAGGDARRTDGQRGRRAWAGGGRGQDGSCLVGREMDQAVIWRPVSIQN